MAILQQCFSINYVENEKLAQPYLYFIEIKQEKNIEG